MERFKISEDEASRVLVKRVNDRPNALATYGIAKKNSTQAKDIFDRQFELVKEKFNGLIDEVAAELAVIKADIYANLGEQGAVEIPINAWSESSAIITINGIGESDMILFSPATEADKVTLNNCGVFIAPVVNEGLVRLSCRVKPTIAISLVYFITRGAE